MKQATRAEDLEYKLTVAIVLLTTGLMTLLYGVTMDFILFRQEWPRLNTLGLLGFALATPALLGSLGACISLFWSTAMAVRGLKRSANEDVGSAQPTAMNVAESAERRPFPKWQRRLVPSLSEFEIEIDGQVERAVLHEAPRN